MKLKDIHNDLAVVVLLQGACWLVFKWLYGDGGWTSIFGAGAQVSLVIYFVISMVRNTLERQKP